MITERGGFVNDRILWEIGEAEAAAPPHRRLAGGGVGIVKSPLIYSFVINTGRVSGGKNFYSSDLNFINIKSRGSIGSFIVLLVGKNNIKTGYCSIVIKGVIGVVLICSPRLDRLRRGILIIYIEFYLRIDGGIFDETAGIDGDCFGT